ncbi:MAG: DegQ family serine endoprotease [Rhodospirillaceae bacterium]|nr:MAG: DegQ family serine endoprotease [Rhodospirillaceae bacterium]
MAAGPVAADDRALPVNRQQVTLSFAPVVKQVAPAVVNIYTRKVVQTRVNPLFDDPFFRQFFGGNGVPGLSQERVQNSLGSGVIVRSTGVIITNNHVTGGADQIKVVLADKREFDAKIIGADERSDLAVLQLQKVNESLPALDLADSDQVEVGDMVLAIGDPFGVGQTVTSGIVSALARSAIDVGGYRSFIQTDAAINPGNSGGALVTSDGRLIGINTAIYSQSGGNIGIGFAIPSNMVRTVLASILKQGHAVHAWFGATGQTVTADLAKNLGLSRPQGVAITRVTTDSPAARAGIRTGDVVRKVNGRAIGDADELRYILATLQVGSTATLDLTRDGADLAVRMAIEAPPEMPPRRTTLLKGRQPLAGVTVANLNPALADELGIQFDEPGVIITKISDDSYAARIGVQVGDIVWDVNGETAKTVDDLVRLLAIPVDGWKVTLNRGGRSIQFSVSN